MSELEIKILIEEDSLEKFREILEQLMSEGFEERTAFEEIGLIFGVVPSAQFESLSKIEGILKVSAEQSLEAFTTVEAVPTKIQFGSLKNVKLEEE